MADGLDPTRVIQAMARPGVGDELHALGVRDLSGFGDIAVDWPPENESRVRQLVESFEREVLAGGAAPRKHGPEPHPIATTDYLEVVKLLGEGRSLRQVAETTGLSRQDVCKIRDSENGRGYTVEPGPISRTVVLRRLEKPR